MKRQELAQAKTQGQWSSLRVCPYYGDWDSLDDDVQQQDELHMLKEVLRPQGF